MELRRIAAKARKASRRALLEREALRIADRERERLGRELHDGLCQSLAGIAALSAALASTLAAKADTASAATAVEMTQLLNRAIGEARDLARGLGPIGPEETGLPDALATLARNTRHLFHVDCSFTGDCRCSGLRRETGSHLYRIAQEAVRNAIAHGRADRIEIGLTCGGGNGVLSVCDNGLGMSDHTRNRNGIGLHTMAYRAHAIGGVVGVARQLPRGTLVTCVFPSPPARSV